MGRGGGGGWALRFGVRFCVCRIESIERSIAVVNWRTSTGLHVHERLKIGTPLGFRLRAVEREKVSFFCIRASFSFLLGCCCCPLLCSPLVLSPSLDIQALSNSRIEAPVELALGSPLFYADGSRAGEELGTGKLAECASLASPSPSHFSVDDIVRTIDAWQPVAPRLVTTYQVRVS